LLIAGYSSAALMAILVAIPFAVRVLFHNEVGEWTNIYLAFFHTYLELYLGNSCLGKTDLETLHIQFLDDIT